MRRLRLLGVSLLAVLAAGANTVGATGPGAVSEAATFQPRLQAIRAEHQPGFDRLIFRFSGRLPQHTTVRWTNQVRDCASGRSVPVAGNALLSVDLRDVQWTVPVPGRRAFALPNLTSIVPSCRFEGVLGYGIGVMKRTTLRTHRLHNPSRFVVDVGTNFRKSRVKVFFLDQQRFAVGREPYTRAVWRWAPLPAVGRGALHRLYAGPTAAERSHHLRFVSSRSTGFRNLSIAPNKVARVQLTGRCSSGGSTFTVANQIFPTLKQFPTVRWVKIYDPDGHTQNPAGRSDSIPECLEP